MRGRGWGRHVIVRGDRRTQATRRLPGLGQDAANLLPGDLARAAIIASSKVVLAPFPNVMDALATV